LKVQKLVYNETCLTTEQCDDRQKTICNKKCQCSDDEYFNGLICGLFNLVFLLVFSPLIKKYFLIKSQKSKMEAHVKVQLSVVNLLVYFVKGEIARKISTKLKYRLLSLFKL
jgi:hypothetical protein